MEFNTDSVWSLISLLILIIIGIVVWYFYNEVGLLNAKVTWMEGKIEETVSQIYKQIYDLQTNNSDLQVEYGEEDNLDFEDGEGEEDVEEERSESECVECPEEEFEQEHPSIDTFAEETGCEHTMITGKRKGQSCGKPVKEDGKCSAHCD